MAKCFSKPAARDHDAKKPRARAVHGRRHVVVTVVLFASSARRAAAQTSYTFTSKADLKTAVDAWVSDSTTAAATYGDINSWDVSQITDFDYLFCGDDHSYYAQFGCNAANQNFNDDISNWDVSGVTTMYWTFDDAHSFNIDIGSWDVSSCTDFGYMFNEALAFNADIGSWSTSAATSMREMFEGSGFNQDISAWDISNCENIGEMFKDNTVFNQDLSAWETGASVNDVYRTFYGATSFNQSLCWDLSLVPDHMFDELFYLSSGSIGCDTPSPTVFPGDPTAVPIPMPTNPAVIIQPTAGPTMPPTIAPPTLGITPAPVAAGVSKGSSGGDNSMVLIIIIALVGVLSFLGILVMASYYVRSKNKEGFIPEGQAPPMAAATAAPAEVQLQPVTMTQPAAKSAGPVTV